MYRQTIVSHLKKGCEELSALLKEWFFNQSALSVTVDIWSDKPMRGFLGVTAHYFIAGRLTSSTLAVQRFMGKIQVLSL